MRRIALLGSTGSIGLQALEVIARFPDRFSVAALACASSADRIVAQARACRPRLVAIADERAAHRAAVALRDTDTQVLAGPAGIVQCATLPEADMVLAAMVGAAGLPPVWEAVRAGKRIGLANKEPLVVAGQLITREAARTGAQLLPIDSEHSAIFQLLQGQDRRAVRRVVLTASGGAFRGLSPEQLARVTPEQALAHPTWKMGPKVTVDSATLMNKGLELIEAHWLFGLAPEQLDVVLHRESVVHSLVEFVDGSVLAQLARPDMRLPIQYALGYPERLPRDEPPLDLAQCGALRFEPLPQGRYPCLDLARQALCEGGRAPAALNAADEVAVAWFLEGRLPFTQIPRLLDWALSNHERGPGDTLEELVAADREIRQRLHQEWETWTSPAA